MGQLQLKLGSTTAGVTIPDDKLQSIVTIFFEQSIKPAMEARGETIPTTPQDILQAVLSTLAQEMRDTARNLKRQEITKQYQEIQNAAMDEIDI